MMTKRIAQIVAALPGCRVLADIGCDHGYVGIAALEAGKAEQVIFVDISSPSLEKARQNCSESLKTRAKFVQQDGLRQIQADCAVIAGMGGLEIISVLQEAYELPDYLVLQPMRNQRDVRLWLSKRYEILSDFTFADGKFYDLIVAKKCDGGCRLDADEITFGKTNLSNPSGDFVLYLQKEQAKYKQILQQCNTAEAVQRYGDVNRILADIMEEQK